MQKRKKKKGKRKAKDYIIIESEVDNSLSVKPDDIIKLSKCELEKEIAGSEHSESIEKVLKDQI